MLSKRSREVGLFQREPVQAPKTMEADMSGNESAEDRVPRVFVGAASEQRDIVGAVQANLDDVAHVEPWYQVFSPVGTIIDSLRKRLALADFAIFILAPDDKVTMRNREMDAVRDNVLFEIGLAVGQLGTERTILVAPYKSEKLRIPSDLAGVIRLNYRAGKLKEHDAETVLGPACTKIRKHLKEAGPPKPLTPNQNRHMVGEWECKWWWEGPCFHREMEPKNPATTETGMIEDRIDVSVVTVDEVRARGKNPTGDYDIEGRITNANFVILRYEPRPGTGIETGTTLGGVAILALDLPRTHMRGFWYEFGSDGLLYGGETTWTRVFASARC